MRSLGWFTRATSIIAFGVTGLACEAGMGMDGDRGPEGNFLRPQGGGGQTEWTVTRMGDALFRRGRRMPAAGGEAGQVEELAEFGPHEVITAAWVGEEVAVLLADQLLRLDSGGGITDTVDLQALSSESRVVEILVWGDTIALWDARTGSAYLRPPGEPVSEPRRLVSDATVLYPGWVRSRRPPRMHGRIVRTVEGFIYEARPFERQFTGPNIPSLLVHEYQGSVDTLIEFDTPAHGTPLWGGHWVCCKEPRFFTPQAWWAVQGDSLIVFANGSQGEFWIVTLSGEIRRWVSWTTSQDEIEDEEIFEYRVRDLVTGFGIPLDSAQKLVHGTRRAFGKTVTREHVLSDQLPTVTQLLLDDGDRIWVRRFHKDSWPSGLSPVWDVFDSSGSYLVALHVPLTYVFEIRGGRILGSVVSGDGSETVAVLTIDRLSGL